MDPSTVRAKSDDKGGGSLKGVLAMRPLEMLRNLKVSIYAMLAILFLTYVVCFGIQTSAATTPTKSYATRELPEVSQGMLHRRSYFYIGATYVPIANETSAISAGQMYVERLTPLKVRQNIPIVIIHGRSMTGTNFLNTPNGRPGWADYFLSQGYELYIIDQPSRARSPWQQGVDGPQTIFDALRIEQRFTATKRFNLWPNAGLHTQWPGNGSRGDETFDSFYASIVPALTSNAEASQKFIPVGLALLDKIGPAILITHSQSGLYGWPLADARPQLVKAIVALEPLGPPFINAVFPPFEARSPADLQTVITYSTTNFTCIQQASPPRKLTNLSNIPVLVVTSESGFHSVFDWCSVQFLKDAGVPVEHAELGKVGIKGNGHMLFMEENSLKIAERPGAMSKDESYYEEGHPGISSSSSF
ncbi:hypothetical protein NLJ89_g778 [Agrocybe chaxingu]|uniref:AB hydrolase-1 domain-containing protein n=1 Tax=Agrocybe chaxingu TaxID=84603 RepID=A0A9W8N1B5_9AGAR|nr:hypothetical protein NLJ89_g778 [Agrocybe chaxingu]